MLKVTLHYATPRQVSARNIIGRLDIGYAKLDAHADYKGVMQSSGIGEHGPVRLMEYPRWSASVWDLVARMACLSLNRQEAIWPASIPHQRRAAFIDNMTAVIEHWPDGSETRRSHIGSAHVAMQHRRCRYTATFTDDILGPETTSVFAHTPDALNPWDLLTRAYAWSAHERFELPPRPELCVPIPVAQGSEFFIALDTVQEPARTGIQRWLVKQGLHSVVTDLFSSPCITETQFVEFLRRAV